MDHSQFMMLTGAAAYSLPSMLIIFFAARLALYIFLKPKPSSGRIVLAFVGCWVATSFYIPFKSLSYYQQSVDNGLEMYLAQLIFSVLALFAVTKLSLTKSSLPADKA